MAQTPIRGIATAGRTIAAGLLERDKRKRDEAKEKAKRDQEIAEAKLETEFELDIRERERPGFTKFARETGFIDKFEKLAKTPSSNQFDRLFEQFSLEEDEDSITIKEGLEGLIAEATGGEGGQEDLLGDTSLLGLTEAAGQSPELLGDIRGLLGREVEQRAARRGELGGIEAGAKAEAKGLTPGQVAAQERFDERQRVAKEKETNRIAETSKTFSGFTESQKRAAIGEEIKQRTADFIALANDTYQEIIEDNPDLVVTVGKNNRPVANITSLGDIKDVLENAESNKKFLGFIGSDDDLSDRGFLVELQTGFSDINKLKTTKGKAGIRKQLEELPLTTEEQAELERRKRIKAGG